MCIDCEFKFYIYNFTQFSLTITQDRSVMDHLNLNLNGFLWMKDLTWLYICMVMVEMFMYTCSSCKN